MPVNEPVVASTFNQESVEEPNGPDVLEQDRAFISWVEPYRTSRTHIRQRMPLSIPRAGEYNRRRAGEANSICPVDSPNTPLRTVSPGPRPALPFPSHRSLTFLPSLTNGKYIHEDLVNDAILFKWVNSISAISPIFSSEVTPEAILNQSQGGMCIWLAVGLGVLQ